MTVSYFEENLFQISWPAIYRQADLLITGYSINLAGNIRVLQFCYTQQLTASVTVFLHSAAHCKCYSFATL